MTSSIPIPCLTTASNPGTARFVSYACFVVQFKQTLSSNLAKLYGTVSVSVTSVTSGSIVVTTAVLLSTASKAEA